MITLRLKHLIASLFPFLLIGFISCQQEEALTPNKNATPPLNTNGTTATTTGSMQANISGSGWVAATSSSSIIGGIINVTGTSSDGSLITITLTGDTVGTYRLGLDGNAVYQVNSSENYNAGVSGGTVTVSTINATDKVIIGSFEFIGHNTLNGDSVIVTNGQFTIPYATSIPPTGGNSLLAADVDGVTFNASTVTGIILNVAGVSKLAITGSDSQGSESIGFQIPEDIQVGSYALGSIFTDYVGLYNRNSTGMDAYESYDGQLLIGKHDRTAKEIEGTFFFNATELMPVDTVIITNGSFIVSY